MAQEPYDSLIFIDDLTGFFNRRYLYAQLPKEIEQAKANNQKLWVMMMDIDNFKMANDTYGHLSGDQLLRDISVILKANTKINDKRIRYAGDEFTFILPNIERKDTTAIAKRLVKRIDASRFKELSSGKEMHITISIGIAGFPQDSTDPEKLVNLADKSLYISKQKGKNCVSFVSEITPDLLWKKDMLERFPCPVFADRHKELAFLNDALKQTQQPKSSFILICGAMGIGKTRLLNEFQRSLAPEELICLSVRCIDKFLTQPYHALTEALDIYFNSLTKMPPGILQDIKDAELEVLWNLIPSLKDLVKDSASKMTEPAEEKTELKEIFFRLLLNLTHQNQVCFLIDELHYIDAQSLEVLWRFLQHEKEARLLVVSTFLKDKLSFPDTGESPLAKLINNEAFVKFSQTLELSGLNPQDTETMVSNILANIPLSNEFSAVFHRVTGGGNPLFVEELLKYCIDKELVFYKDGKWQQKEISENDLPSSVEAVVEARLEALSPEIKEMIAKAAAIGDNFQVDLLRRIDSEDRGYVMDLIETAKKLSLIYEKGKDEFAFAAGNMRDILFKMVGKERKKLFYAHLAETIEKLHADKLGSVAGELYHAFKNAEDDKRAQQYAKISREEEAILQTQKMQYAQTLLKEAELDKLLIPLSKDAWVIAPELIRSIYIATVNHLLYPPQNRMRVQSIEDIHNKLTSIFSEVDLLNIAYTGNSLFINKKKIGKELSSFFTDSVINILGNLNIESITFFRAVGVEELDTLIGVFSRPQEQGENLMQSLQDRGVTHIQIKEVTFTASWQKTKQKEGFQDTMFLDYLLGDMPLEEATKADLATVIRSRSEDIAKVIERLGEQISQGQKSDKDKEIVKAEVVSKSIEKIGRELLEKDAEKWPEYKGAILKTILSMEPRMRAEIFLSQPESAGEDKDKRDIIKEIILDLPDDALVDTIISEYTRKDTDMKKVRNLTQRLLADPQKKEKLIPLIKEKLKAAKASDEECNWIFAESLRETAPLSTEEKISKITQSSSDALMKILPMINLEELLKELLAKNLSAPIEKIEDKIVGLTREKDIDMAAVGGYLNKFLAICTQDSSDIFLPELTQRLLNECAKGGDFLPVFCSIAAPYLNKIIQAFLKTGKTALIADVIKVYTNNENITQEYSAVLDAVAERLVDEFIRRIELGLDWATLVELLILFRNKAVKLMFEKALFQSRGPSGKYFEAYLVRRTVGRVLGAMPKEYLSGILSEERFSNASRDEISNTIEIIGAMDNENLVNILEVPLKHPDFMIRRKVIFNLSKMKGRNSAQLLKIALQDPDEKLRNVALDTLKNRKDEFAKQILAVDYEK